MTLKNNEYIRETDSLEVGTTLATFKIINGDTHGCLNQEAQPSRGCKASSVILNLNQTMKRVERVVLI